MGCSNSTDAAAPGAAFDVKYENTESSAGLGLTAEDQERMQAHNVPADTLSLDDLKLKADELFKRIDIDGSQAIDKDEFVALASQHKSKNAKKQAAIDRKADAGATKLMQECDTDNNGDVSPSEWVQMFVNSHKRDGPVVATDMIKWFTLLAEVLEQEKKEAAAAAAAE